MLILTFEGFTPVVLSAYGGNFGATPNLDRMAAAGWLVDRAITTRRRGIDNLAAWLAAEWPAAGITLITDSPAAANVIDERTVGEIQTIDNQPVGAAKPAGDAETSLGQLLAAAAERLDDPDRPAPEVLWLHSDFLVRRWDGATPVDTAFATLDDEPEIDDRPDWTVDLHNGEATDEELHTMRIAADALLPADQEDDEPLLPIPRLDVTEPPSLAIGDDDDPDLMVTWGQTYADQVALIDRLVPLTAALAAMFPGGAATRVIAGTSGFSLGQNGWISATEGPLRSGSIEVPWIVVPVPAPTDRVAMRLPGPVAADGLIDQLCGRRIDDGFDAWVEAVAHRGDEMSAAVRTEEAGRPVATTTRGWFHNVDDGTLFLKPDDRFDANNIADRRPDVVDQFGSIHPI